MHNNGSSVNKMPPPPPTQWVKCFFYILFKCFNSYDSAIVCVCRVQNAKNTCQEPNVSKNKNDLEFLISWPVDLRFLHELAKQKKYKL